MSDVGGLSKSDMLTAAKRKLKDFEARRNLESRNSPTSSVISSEPGGNHGVNGRSSCISDDSARNGDFSTSSVYQEQQNPQLLNNRGQNHSVASNHGSLTNGNEWYQAYVQLKTQHDELCAHYSQLHSAYSQINANGVHVDVENQIVNLQAALSTMVEEKVACQAELRRTVEELEKLKEETNKRMQKVEEPVKHDIDSQEKRHLLANIAEKDSLLSARHYELENMRREMATIQANLLNVQHERSEAQARVKSLVRDNSALEQNVQQLRKDMQMKDLYLKQFGAHNVPNGGSVDQNTVQQLNDKIEDLNRQIAVSNEEKARLLAEAATLKSHYSEREHALQQKQVEMAAELEQLSSHRFSSDDRVQQLEHQLHLANVEVERLRAKASIDSSEIPEHHLSSEITEEEVGRRIREAVHAERGQWEKKMEEEQRSREEDVLSKDRVIFEREQALAEVEMKYRLLEERTLESTANGADLLSLSEQLQNEKATVSRAVAQNRELKSQLIETEDRMIALTEEKLQLELAKQAAEHQVRELAKQMHLEAAGLVSSNDTSHIDHQKEPEGPQTISNVEPIDNSGNSPLGQNSENVDELKENLETYARQNEQMRAQLQQTVGELTQVRAELRRSNTQNEQMDEIMRQNAEDENQNSIHVELTQAVGRVNDLAAENEQLREALNDMSKQLNEERARVVESEKRLDEQLEERKKENERIELEKSQKILERKQENGTMHEEEPENIENRDLSRESEELWARKKLEKRFARAMMQNAELTETIDRLEHVNQQLELENDTIADHVVLYQHQRKLIRERLRVKDEQLKSMEDDRARTVERCQELQNVLMTVLSKGGVLKEYEKSTRKIARKVSRSYSHSTVDEMSGDEDVIVDAKEDLIPKRENSDSPTADSHGTSPADISDSVFPVIHSSPTSPNEDGATSSNRASPKLKDENGSVEQDASVRRILEVISDISRPQLVLPGQLHCTQCIGELQEL